MGPLQASMRFNPYFPYCETNLKLWKISSSRELPVFGGRDYPRLTRRPGNTEPLPQRHDFASDTCKADSWRWMIPMINPTTYLANKIVLLSCTLSRLGQRATRSIATGTAHIAALVSHALACHPRTCGSGK